jgi:hypothetical protein
MMGDTITADDTRVLLSSAKSDPYLPQEQRWYASLYFDAATGLYPLVGSGGQLSVFSPSIHRGDTRGEIILTRAQAQYWQFRYAGGRDINECDRALILQLAHEFAMMPMMSGIDIEGNDRFLSKCSAALKELPQINQDSGDHWGLSIDRRRSAPFIARLGAHLQLMADCLAKGESLTPLRLALSQFADTHYQVHRINTDRRSS